MHANAHHLGAVEALGVSLRIETVEAVLEVLKEGVAVSVALWQRKPHVVAVQGVGNDELMAVCAITLTYLHPKGQVIPVVISVVGKAAKVGHDLVCVRAVSAGVPAQRTFAK